MENSNTILNELKEISLVVAAIGHQQPYTVPEGYFESLPVQVMLRIAMEEKAGADPVVNINKDHVYQAPPGYFDTLASSILNRIKAEESGNYLEEPDFSSPLWQQVGKKNPFAVPTGYFDEFSDNIVAGAKAIEFVNEELENLSPLMTSLKSKQVYDVPQDYFDTTAAAILQKATEQPSAKVISIGFGKKMMRYAAAAVVAGLVIVSGYFITKTPDQIAVTGNKQTTFDSLGVAKLSDQDLESFLNSASIADTSILITVDDEITGKESKDLLANVSDEELQQYLEQFGSTPNAITN